MNHLSLIRTLQERVIQTITPLMEGVTSIVLVDFPDHTNVGDSMIWLGELDFLRSLGLRPKYVCSYRNYSRQAIRNRVGSNGLILIHGGGNFGTLWPQLHEFRERVLSDFPDHRVIQMPQSIFFDGTRSLEQTQHTIEQHPLFTLLARDHVSFHFAQRHFSCSSFLCPDMAFMLGALSPDIAPVVDLFVLARTDRERQHDWGSMLTDGAPKSTTGDWLEPSTYERLLTSAAHRMKRLLAPLDRDNLYLNILWGYTAKERLSRGLRVLSQGRVIITDRLHAHILSTLMGKPHVVVGNNNGKIRSFYETWTDKLDLVSWSNTPQAAYGDALSLLESR